MQPSPRRPDNHRHQRPLAVRRGQRWRGDAGAMPEVTWKHLCRQTEIPARPDCPVFFRPSPPAFHNQPVQPPRTKTRKPLPTMDNGASEFSKPLSSIRGGDNTPYHAGRRRTLEPKPHNYKYTGSYRKDFMQYREPSAAPAYRDCDAPEQHQYVWSVPYAHHTNRVAERAVRAAKEWIIKNAPRDWDEPLKLTQLNQFLQEPKLRDPKPETGNLKTQSECQDEDLFRSRSVPITHQETLIKIEREGLGVGPVPGEDDPSS
ncbi:hypothetical protein EYF80_047684 [Liparis tanakae]|uniref:Uncharacterized protein n=1 Tax=Liparis tanakae TaxID=230148 RepID=A0A4Z2FM94_9TELE|nr:hypothetical protein EYF80_047684 [Liparis tanakae]